MLYLRDLEKNIRAEYERDIRKNRPDLVKFLDDTEESHDIIVADDRSAKDYELN